MTSNTAGTALQSAGAGFLQNFQSALNSAEGQIAGAAGQAVSQAAGGATPYSGTTAYAGTAPATTTSSSSNTWLILAAIGLGVFLISRK